MTRSIILLLVIAVAAGCSRQETPPDNAEDAVVVDDGAAFDELFGQARAHFHEGDTDSAVELLTEGLADPQFVDNQPTIFRALIELLLLENRVVDAQTNFIAMLHASPDTAARAFNMIPSHLKRDKDPSGYLAWCEQMVNMELPPELEQSAYAYYVDANMQAGNLDRMEQLARESISRFGGTGAVRVLTRPVNDLIDKEEFATIHSALAALTATGDSAALDFATGIQITLAAAQGQWDSAVSMFMEKAAELPDSASGSTLRTVGARALKAERTDVVDQLCEHVMSTLPDASSTRALAVTLYLDVAETAEDYDLFVERLREVSTTLQTPKLRQTISAVFYDVMSKGSGASKQELLQLVESMMAKASEQGVSQLQALLMDGAVLSDDYALALKVLDSGFRADDEAWVAMARNKLGAHLAVSEGRTDDAVRMFRDFMKHVETWTEATVDPSTGISHTREMSLGFNAKRIGDIYRDAARADDAAKAYAEAHAYFDQALAAAAPGSKEEAYISEQLAELHAAETARSL